LQLGSIEFSNPAIKNYQEAPSFPATDQPSAAHRRLPLTDHLLPQQPTLLHPTNPSAASSSPTVSSAATTRSHHRPIQISTSRCPST